jgi:hypothetical protein
MALLTIERKRSDVLPTLQNVVGIVTDKSTGTVEWDVNVKTPDLTAFEIVKLKEVHTKSLPNLQRAKEVKAVYKPGYSVDDVMKQLGTRYSRTMVAIDLQAFRKGEAKPPINIKK